MRVLPAIALLILVALSVAPGTRARAEGEPVGLVQYTALGDSVTWQNQ